MTPHYIIAKIRERFPELGKDVLMTTECCCVGHNACPDSHFRKEWSPLDWSHVLRVMVIHYGLDLQIIGEYSKEPINKEFLNLFVSHELRADVDLTKSPEWNIENNKDFASLLEGCLTE